jgi:hypothetical protein
LQPVLNIPGYTCIVLPIFFTEQHIDTIFLHFCFIPLK